ncbi:MAG: hypothetical protein HZA90_20465 [Verrucomicrobia bacterium]|nr:hypothetical protein [Verrucomicrobiota bacterium]
MTPRLAPRRFLRGNTYLTIIWIAMLSGLILAAYLTMVSTQNSFSMRSQAWNRCIAVSEAGIEEALSHLYKNGVTNGNLYEDGWWNLGGQYYKRRCIDDCLYEVTISPEANPVILSRGYVPLVQNYAKNKGWRAFMADAFFWWGARSDNYLHRTIRVETTADGMFAKGLVAKHWIDLNGNNIRTDSFDSVDPSYSSNGLYCLSKAKDNGDIATNSGLTNSANIDVGNANIYGHAFTGPKGKVVWNNGAVGSKAWHDGGNSGIQPGWFRDDMNVSFPDVPAPFTSGYFTPSSGSVDGTNYDLVLGSGKYLSSSNVKYTSKATIFVNGDAIWWCKAGIDIGGQGTIIIAPNARLQLCIGDTSGSGVSAAITGNGVQNGSGNATNCFVYGLRSNTSITWSGNSAFTGAIYAPRAAVSMSGGGSDTLDFCGAGVFSTITMNGHYNFHYDENLGRFGPRRGYVIASWNEM